MRIDSSGNVGIGTTSPGAKLDVNGEVFFSTNTAGKNTHTFTTNASNDGRYLIKSDTTTKVDIQANGTSFFNGGNVGIGTSSPGEKLQVNGNLMVGDDLTAGSFVDIIGAGSSQDFGVRLGLESDRDHKAAILTNTSVFDLRFNVNSAERMRIDSSGNVGIGKTSSGNKLEIEGQGDTKVVIDSRTDASNGSDAILELWSKNSSGTNNFGFIDYDGDGNFEIGSGGSGAGSVPLVFKTNASERMRIDSSGQLGIGTTSPSGLLHVNGIARFDNYINFGGIISTPATSAAIYRPADNQLAFSTANSERMRIDNSGNVNIGSNIASNPFAYLRFGASQHGAADIRPTNEGSHKVGLSLYTDGTQDTTINPTERMRIDSSGRVGVGTTSPSCTTGGIHAVHDATQGTPSFTGAEVGIFQRNFNGAQDCAVSIVSGTNASSIINFGDKDDVNPGIIEYLNGSNDMRFSTNASERMRLRANGRINFGQAFDTGSALSVKGSWGQGVAGGMVFYHNNAITSGRADVIYFSHQGTIVGEIDMDNNDTAYRTTSDYRLKENQVAISDGIERVKQLSPYRFNWISTPAKTVDGFFAHEVQTVVPEAVSGSHNAVDDDNNPIYQGIDQAKLVPLLTAALQEAIAKIETLETKVAALESE